MEPSSVQSIHDSVIKYIKNMGGAYRGLRPIVFELYQPVRGLENLVLMLLMLLRFSMLTVAKLFSHKGEMMHLVYKDLIVETATQSLDLGVSGLTQLATTPVTWFITIPVRGLLTLISGWEYVEDGRHMKRILKEAHDGVEKGNQFAVFTSFTLLHKKYTKAVKDKEHCRNMDTELEQDLYEGLDAVDILKPCDMGSITVFTEKQKTSCFSYLNFFKKPETDTVAHSDAPLPTA